MSQTRRPGPAAGFFALSWSRLRRRLTPGRVAFVLSGGGPLGAVQVGMLRALAEAGVVPDLVVGCSVGAINGAGFAAQPDLGGVERLERIWRRIGEGEPDLMPSRRLPILAQMARKGDALHDIGRLADLLDEELPTRTFSGLQVPFTCVATDLETSAEHWFDSGRLLPALLASAALPVVYPPVQHGPHTLIDGGVLNEVHAAKAAELGATELYILHVGHLEDRAVEVQRPFDAAVRAYWTARRFRLEDDLRRVPPHCVVHRLPAGSNPRMRFDDFSQAEPLSTMAYRATSQYLRTGRVPVPVSGPVSEPADTAPTDGDHDDEGWADEVVESGPEPTRSAVDAATAEADADDQADRRGSESRSGRSPRRRFERNG